MMTGIVIANVIPAIAALFVKDRQRALCAVAIGLVTALVFVIYMAVSIDDALCLDEKGAAAQMRKHMLIRYAFVCAVFAVSIYFKAADPLFLTISILMICLLRRISVATALAHISSGVQSNMQKK